MGWLVDESGQPQPGWLLLPVSSGTVRKGPILCACTCIGTCMHVLYMYRFRYRITSVNVSLYSIVINKHFIQWIAAFVHVGYMYFHVHVHVLYIVHTSSIQGVYKCVRNVHFLSFLQYYYHSMLVAIIGTAIFIRLNWIIKCTLNLVALIVYLVVILDVRHCLFDNYDKSVYGICRRYMYMHVHVFTATGTCMYSRRHQKVSVPFAFCLCSVLRAIWVGFALGNRAVCVGFV